MAFNSVVFLFCFLPLALLVYYLVPGRAKNADLLLESLLFYCWAGVRYLPLALILIALHYAAGLLIEHFPANRGMFLAGSVVVSAGVLAAFKYLNTLLALFHQISSAGLSSVDFFAVLPLGISYYIFKLISYTADVCTGKIKAERDPITFAAYVLFFPQIVIGPIIKYRDMAAQLHTFRQRYTLSQIEAGAEQFVFGLAKKVILADSIGALWQDIIGSGGIGLAQASTPLAWLGVIAYSLQLYFDFAGYSEMSNGLSQMLGFDCAANFDLPYISASITEFWRRWHISLSSWFREYIYIPLGGNRCGAVRQMFNMLVVWVLTGVWHGNTWNFVCWGLFYLVLLVIEKNLLLPYLKRGRIWPHLYTLFFVVIGWAIFTANEPGAPLGLLLSKLFLPQGGISALYYLRNYGVLLLVGALCSTPLPSSWWKKLRSNTLARLLVFGGAMVLSVAYVVAATGSTALYANF